MRLGGRSPRLRRKCFLCSFLTLHLGRFFCNIKRRRNNGLALNPYFKTTCYFKTTLSFLSNLTVDSYNNPRFKANFAWNSKGSATNCGAPSSLSSLPRRKKEDRGQMTEGPWA